MLASVTLLLDSASLARAAEESGEPLYRVLAGILRARIRAGKYQPGEMLYSIRDLVETCGVAKGTVVETYEELEREGLVLKKRTGHYLTTDRKLIEGFGSLDQEVADFRMRLRAARGFNDDEIDAAFKRSRRAQ